MKKLAPVFIALIFCGLSVQPLWAKHDEDHGPDWKHGHEEGRTEAVARGVIIVPSDRKIIRGYLVENYRAHCPPGLAKKHNGCLPPGQAKKYPRGYILPETVVWEPAPPELVGRLRPPPPGASYVVVDRNVLLISEATRKVLDAVTLLSAVH